MTDWSQAALFQLLDHVYVNSGPLVVTSNLSLTDLTARMGDRFASRLLEMTDSLRVDGDDMRLKMAMERRERREGGE